MEKEIGEILKSIKKHLEDLATKGWNRLYYERDRNVVVTYKEDE